MSYMFFSEETNRTMIYERPQSAWQVHHIMFIKIKVIILFFKKFREIRRMTNNGEGVVYFQDCPYGTELGLF